MPKPTIEFTPVSEFTVVKPSEGELTHTYSVLSEDADTGDKTILLKHPPGQEWGGTGGKDTQAQHIYWEEVLILRGRIYDKSLKLWFSADHYCCRPPGMLHGPWIADPEEGCEELVFIKH